MKQTRLTLTPQETTVVQSDSVTFRAVASVIHLGLSILETPHGRSGLTAIGTAVIAYRRNSDHIYEDDPENMPWWVDLFLLRLRASFPVTVLTNRIGGEGQTVRANRGRGGVKMRQWDADNAGVLRLNKLIMRHLVRAGEKAAQKQELHEAHMHAFESFIFLMAVTVSHELTHFFVGFLTGYDWPSTPQEVSFLPELYNSTMADGTTIGESGRAEYEANTPHPSPRRPRAESIAKSLSPSGD
ncbi:hypothetical protein F5Y16DRAFT_422069 [Xylariaceae sp. FL0255]|nr:hypothetical protein F5Y16DRAFT_422069 [Xylariaceae sp. FL0255]